MPCLRPASLAALGALMGASVMAQTSTDCNPLYSTSCSDETALGMTIDVDFTQGSVNSFGASGSPTYDDSNGVSFTVSQGGDAPQLSSIFTIMFGRVEITMKAAPGDGIVSSVVLESADLDEIDMEWLGSQPDQMQSNYFGKGKTTDYNRGQWHDVSDTQSEWITYTVDWTSDRIIWMAGGTVLRTLTYDDAETDQYPQTPMQVKFGAWAGGDPNYNAAGTVKWAQGPVDYSDGPFTMMVQSLIITDYSTGDKYSYTDTSGSWESIEAVNGEVNGNIDADNAVTITATAQGSVVTTAMSIPVGGIGTDGSTATVTETGWPWNSDASPTEGAIPSGWVMTSEGKLIPAASPALRPPSIPGRLLAPLLGVLALTSWLS